MHNGEISFWMQDQDAARPTRPALFGDDEADVVVVGGGFTGLWTAYRLVTQRPGLRVVVLEARYVGYGASGRNDGWVSALMSATRRKLAAYAGGTEPVVEFQRTMVDAVDEILAVCAAEGIDADQVKGGHLRVARTGAALARLRASREAALRWGYRPEEVRMLDLAEVDERIRVSGAVGGMVNTTTAKLHPAKLVAGLARAVEARGVTIHEGTPVTHVGPGEARTAAGRVRARTVLLATEAYTPTVGGAPRRGIVPVNSSIVLTAPLTADQWDAIGWRHDECFGDAAHVFTYAQRTADGRIAIGGRGDPYRYASGVGDAGEVDDATVDLLTRQLRGYFPVLGDLPVEHAWCGVIGVTRDWCASVHHDPATGLGSAGGYAGHGVASSYVAAFTLADRVLGVDSKYARAPWFGYRSKTWEPEPLRWLGIHGMYRLFDVADRSEESRGAEKTSAWARIGGRLAGLAD